MPLAIEKSQVMQSFVENVQMLCWPACLDLRDNLRVRVARENELRGILFGQGELFGPRIESLLCVIERLLTPDEQTVGSAGFERARLDLQTVFEALLLYHDVLAKRTQDIISIGEFEEIDKFEGLVDQGRLPIWRHSVALHHRFPLELHSEDRSPFRDLWQKLDRIQSKAPYVGVSATRFCMATEMAADPARSLYRFVDYVTSTEALLTTDEPEVSFKLPMRMAVLLAPSPRESQDVFDFMRLAYRVRSRLVHGEALDKLIPLSVRGVEIEFGEGLGRLHSYTRDCIRFAVDLVDAGFNDKKKLLRLLDLATVRQDLRDSTKAFLAGRETGEELMRKLREARQASFSPILHDERGGVLH